MSDRNHYMSYIAAKGLGRLSTEALQEIYEELRRLVQEEQESTNE